MFAITLISAIIIAMAQANQGYVENLQPKVFPLPTRFLAPQTYNQERIVHGTEVEPHSIPYQVGIFFDLPAGKVGFCGGSLISRNYVLTAAHCTNGSSRTDGAEVILGAHRVREEEPTQIRIKSYEMITHDLYTLGSYDIALIRLPEPVELTEYIQVVSLPSRQQQSNSFEAEPALLTGWGKTSDASTSISDVLQYANTFIMENKKCSRFFFGMVKDDHICSDGYNSQVSACNGDSGGPLVVGDTLVGLVSFGSGFGCDAMWPTVYTRITSYLDWIEEHSDCVIRD